MVGGSGSLVMSLRHEYNPDRPSYRGLVSRVLHVHRRDVRAVGQPAVGRAPAQLLLQGQVGFEEITRAVVHEAAAAAAPRAPEHEVRLQRVAQVEMASVLERYPVLLGRLGRDRAVFDA